MNESRLPIPDPQTPLGSVNYEIFRRLCQSLDENDKWRPLVQETARLLSNQAQFPIRRYEEHRSPATAFLEQLRMLNLSVEGLNLLLKKCKLYQELLLTKEDEDLELVKDLFVDTSEVLHNEAIKLVCVFDGFPLPKYRWFCNGMLLVGEEDSTLVIPSFTEQNVGEYFCEATQTLRDSRNSVISTKTVSITLKPFPPEILVQPEDVLALPATTVILRCEGRGWPAPCYEWFKDSKPVPATGNILEIPNLSSEDEGCYVCQVRNSEGFIFSRPISLEVSSGAPSISQHPVLPNNEPVIAGRKLSLHCKAHGQAPLNYKWFCNGKIIGENNPVLDFDVTPVNGLTRLKIKCLVTNQHGSAKTWPVVVNVNTGLVDKKYTATRKVALLIANEAYDNIQPLAKPAADAATLSRELEKLEFTVIPFCNLNITEVRNAVQLLCDFVVEGSYIVIYLAGHGFHFAGNDYFLPVDCPPEKNFTFESSLCINELLLPVQWKEPQLLCVLVDICRVVPNKEMSPELYKLDPKPVPPVSNKNLVIGFATSQYLRAFEKSSDENGIFVTHLKKFISLLISVPELLKRVRKSHSMLASSADVEQLPMDYNYLTEDFSLCDPVTETSGLLSMNAQLLWYSLQELPGRRSNPLLFALASPEMSLFRKIPRFVECVRLDDQEVPVTVEFRKFLGCFFNAMEICISIDSPQQSRDVNIDIAPSSLKYSLKITTESGRSSTCEVIVRNLQTLLEDATLKIHIKDQMIEIPLGKPLVARVNPLIDR